MFFMFIILVLLKSLINVLAVLQHDRNINLTGICGYPGEPLSAQHDFGNQRVFHSGHTVSYQCVDLLGYKQMRTCLNGQWVGPQLRCGYGKDNDLKRVIVKDCYRGSVVADFSQIKLQKNFDRLINSFSTERLVDEQPIRVSNRTCLRWHLYLTNNSSFQLVRTDFVTVFEGVSKSSKEVPVVTAFKARSMKSNLCPIEAMKQYKHIFANKWINFGYKYHFYITCNLNNRTESSNLFVIETQTKVSLTLDLVRFSVAEVYGGRSDPSCGVPEMPVGVIVKPIKEYQLYEVFCEAPHFTNSTHVVRTELMCTSDAIWSGIYPKCKPRMSCDNSHTFKTNSNPPIKSIENVFYYNKTLWFAIKGTVVNYYCGGQGSYGSMNIRSKTCLENGLWNIKGSVCNQNGDDFDQRTVKPVTQSSREPMSQSISSEQMKPIYGMAAFTSLVVIIIAIIALILIWKKINTKEYIDRNGGSPAQNDSKEIQNKCKEKQCEVIGWTDRPITTNTYVDEKQAIFRKQYDYQTEVIYDVPPNNSMAVPFLSKELESEETIISEPIYDRPKQRL